MLKLIKTIAPGDFMAYQKNVLKMLGLGRPDRGNYFYVSLSLIHTLFFNVLLVVLEIVECYLTRSDRKATIMNLAIIALHCSSLVRVGNWYGIRNEIDDVINLIQRNSFEFKNIFDLDYINFEELYGFGRQVAVKNYPNIKKFWYSLKLKSKPAENLNVVEMYKKECWSIASFKSLIFHVVMCFSTVLVLSLAFINSLLSKPSQKYSTYREQITLMKSLPYNMYVPADLSLDVCFVLAWIYQFYAILVTVFRFFAIDCLMIGVMIHIMYQIRVIGKALDYVDCKQEAITEASNDTIIRNIRFVHCIHETQEIFKVMDLLEKLFNKPLLVQYFFITAVICTSVYGINMTNSLVEIVGLSIMVLTVMSEPFILSWNCEAINSELEKFFVRLCEMNWLETEPKFRKMLAYAMARVQKPFVLTIGKFSAINLTFFVSMLKMAYSFYTLLAQTQS